MARKKRKEEIEKELERIERREEDILKLEKAEAKKIGEIEAKERRLERAAAWRWHPAVMVARGFAGAFLGIVLSSFPFSYRLLNAVPLQNAAALFIFVIVSAGLVLFKTERGPIIRMRGFTKNLLATELVVFILTVFIVELTVLAGFGLLATEPMEIVRQLLIFSLPASAGALTLTVI